MPVYQYRGLLINVAENDSEYKGYFEAAREHRLVVRRCLKCRYLRGEPGPGCPWCTSQRWEWHQMIGVGTIYSYQMVVHSPLPGFRDWAPFPLILVELDEQRGQPAPADGLRIVSNLLKENMEPENEENVAIGKRVKVVFMDLKNGLTLPQFVLSDEPPQQPYWQHQL